jgi:N-acetylneuraminate synthase
VRVEIIAEVGVNHDGKLDRAISLVRELSNLDVDVVKFQSFSADDLVTAYGASAAYQQKGRFSESTQYEMLKSLELRDVDYLHLHEYCCSCDVEFMSTPFSQKWLEILLDLGMKRIKVPSGEITNIPYLERLGEYGRSVIMSTGMSTLSEVEHALTALTSGGLSSSDVTLLHCTSNYPADIESANLLAMCTLKTVFGCPVGYSDHTNSMVSGAIAVALGASLVERHVTYDCNADGPDHSSSLDIEKFTEYVQFIRHAEKLLGSSVKSPTVTELETASVARKSIVARQHLSAGTVITADSLAYKRPGNGLSPAMFKDLIGRTLTIDLAKDEQICLDHLK